MLVRCEKHGNPKGRGENVYEQVSFLPTGYLNTAAICGINNCNQAGKVWLTTEEYKQYQKGQRIFKGPSAFVKIKVG